MRGADRIRASFAAAAADGRTALIAYILAGYPSDADALAAAEAALASGADMLEIGVPFSDPMADGPTIAEAGRAALAAGSGLAAAAWLVAELRRRGDRAAADGDELPESTRRGRRGRNDALAIGRGHGRHHRPGSAGGDRPAPRTPRRVVRIGDLVPGGAEHAAEPGRGGDRGVSGFVYVVPLFGVTGARETLAAGARELAASIRARSGGRAPVAVGFGLGSAEQVAELAPHADGLVVGSALVAALRDRGPTALGDLVAALATGTGCVPSGARGTVGTRCATIGGMCFDADSRPPLPPIRGAALDAGDVTLTARDGARVAAYGAVADNRAVPAS